MKNRRPGQLPTAIFMAIEQHGECVYCGDNAEVFDHFVPKALGGSNKLPNLVPACNRCNSSKGAQPFHAWMLRMQKHFCLASIGLTHDCARKGRVMCRKCEHALDVFLWADLDPATGSYL